MVPGWWLGGSLLSDCAVCFEYVLITVDKRQRRERNRRGLQLKPIQAVGATARQNCTRSTDALVGTTDTACFSMVAGDVTTHPFEHIQNAPTFACLCLPMLMSMSAQIGNLW